GDVFVFVFFGLIAVCVTFYVQAGRVSVDAVLASVAVGALTTNILLVNNYRDAGTDAKAGKRTLVVRFGKRFAQGQFVLAHAAATVVPMLLALRGCYSLPAGLGAALFFALAGFWQARALCRATGPGELIALLGRCGAYLAGYAIILAALLGAGK
ncbi:MAG: UbiA family prenyltransferase, partial [Opitutaceae bacterium]